MWMLKTDHIAKFLILLTGLLNLLGCHGILQKEKTTTDRFTEYVDQKYEEQLARFPEKLSYLGRKQENHRLNDYTESFRLREQRIAQEILEETQTLFQLEDFEDFQGRLSYQMWLDQLEKQIDYFQWRHHHYPLSQMFGVHSSIPSLLINIHRIDSEQDAKAYISRITEVSRVMDEVLAGLEAQQRRQILMPRFLYPQVYSDIENLLKGFPLDESEQKHSLFDDFQSKLAKTKLSLTKRTELENACSDALKVSFQPAYQKVLDYLKAQEKRADQRAGAWKLPRGKEFYQSRLEHHTTLPLTPDEIHQIGLKEVDRLQKEMQALQKQLGIKGTLAQFFKYIQNNEELFYPDSAQGRQAYIDDTHHIISEIKKRLPELFGILPKADVVVKAVEPYREKTAGLAFYTQPALDGSRPGIYYINLYDLKSAPKYEMEALAYHEAIPGHHMQLAIAQELQGLPKFRSHSHFTAYVEGWALYAEMVPKELGFYQDPYSEFGRLSMELWRAARLVVDTGLHAKKWSRERAIRYLDQNTPSDPAENIKAIDRYIVLPGQATAYKIGQLKILELRRKAEIELREHFDLRSFHDEILRHGSLPLSLLEEIVNRWIEAVNASKSSGSSET